MNLAVQVDLSAEDASWRRALAETAAAGFEAMEACPTPDAAWLAAMPRPTCESLARQARDSGVRLRGLVLDETAGLQLASPDAVVRRQAGERLTALLDRTLWLGGDCVTLAELRGAVDGAALRYEEVHGRFLDALLGLRFEAQARAVHVAGQAAPGGLPSSPIELRALLDRVNSPWVGACVDVGALPNAPDWIATLGRRIVRAALSNDDSAAWALAAAALRSTPFDGVVVYRGRGDRRIARHRIAEAFSPCVAAGQSSDAGGPRRAAGN